MTHITFTAEARPLTITLGEGDADRRTVTGVAIPYGVPSAPAADGGRYVFTGPPTNADELVDLVREHDLDALLGRLAVPFTSEPDGLHAKARLFATSAGNDALTEAAEGARLGFSIGARLAEWETDDEGVSHVKVWTADHLGLVRRPAFASARVTDVRASAATTTPKESPVTTTTPPAPTEPPAPPTPDVAQLPSMFTVSELADQVAARLGASAGGGHPLAEFSTLASFAARFYAPGTSDDDRQALSRNFAVPDQTTVNNPGVIPPGWRTEVKANIDKRRPAINAFGGPIGLPPAGMVSNWPYLDPAINLDGIIARQTAEKTELSGVPLRILSANEPILTAGTVSDISYQLLQRSSPSYLAAYLNICLAAWARYTEAQFIAALLERGTAAGAMPALTTNAQALRAELFAASADVEDATGEPASVVLVDSSTFGALGGLPDLYNPAYGTQNVAGTAAANTLTVSVNGLTIVRSRFMPAGSMIVASPSAASFAEAGPYVATAEDVRKLGRDVAVWGMYERAEVYFPTGVRVYTTAG